MIIILVECRACRCRSLPTSLQRSACGPSGLRKSSEYHPSPPQHNQLHTLALRQNIGGPKGGEELASRNTLGGPRERPHDKRPQSRWVVASDISNGQPCPT
eukprot:1097534-Pyramimonas_sp.AAC.1